MLVSNLQLERTNRRKGSKSATSFWIWPRSVCSHKNKVSCLELQNRPSPRSSPAPYSHCGCCPCGPLTPPVHHCKKWIPDGVPPPPSAHLSLRSLPSLSGNQHLFTKPYNNRTDRRRFTAQHLNWAFRPINQSGLLMCWLKDASQSGWRTERFHQEHQWSNMELMKATTTISWLKKGSSWA